MMSQIVKQEGVYQAAFRLLQQRTAGNNPAWFARLRESAMDRFEQLGFPSIKEEEWKYTNIAPISKVNFEPVVGSDKSEATLTADEVTRLGYVEAQASQLVFRNGVLHSDLGSLTGLPTGVVAIDLAKAIADEKYGELIREHLARSADYNANAFTALNTALSSSGAFVLIPKGISLESPLHFHFISDPVEPNAAAFPRVLIIGEENSRATIIESHASISEATYFTNAVVEIVLKDGARLEHYKIQRESADAFHIATTSADLGSNSSYDATTINFGAQLSRHDIAVKMANEGAECWVDGLYVVGGDQHTDTHSVIDHQQPHCTSHQLYKGILDGKSRAVFNGKIFVRHGAQKTDAMQTNKNLLLSNEARVDTKPQLEILADDVKCSHGAAVGQIGEEELFYLETRGIHHNLAKNLLTYGFAEEVIAKIKVDSIKAQLDEAVLNRINARLEA
ncbi:MAG TPA: Fe-S cluster assembly protein SufD [Pyrinomonadaceae bacterium]|nr:Fe-S cluster assembly protein SufD [Pyrinomonadaceae bacterium]